MSKRICGVFCEFVTFPLVSWVRCGTWLYWFLIFAPLLTFIVLKAITDSMNINDPVPVKAEQLTAFYAKSHQHQKDIEYQVNCMLAFEGETLSDAHWHVCYKLYVAIRKYFLASKANIYPVCDREILNRQLTDSSKSRVRYVGGYSPKCQKTICEPGNSCHVHEN